MPRNHTLRQSSSPIERLEDRIALDASLPQLAVDGDTLLAPGNVDDIVTVEVRWTTRHAAYDNEFGVLRVEDQRGSVNDVLPGDAGYKATALRSAARDEVFASGDGEGVTTTLELRGNERLLPYVVVDASTEELLDLLTGGESLRQHDAFFAAVGANSDGFDHFRFEADDNGLITVSVEDIRGGGDRDFTDVVATFEVVSIAEREPRQAIELVTAPAAVALDVDSATLDLSKLGPGTHTVVVHVGGDVETGPEVPAGQVIIHEDFTGGRISADWTEANSTDNRGRVVQLDDGDYAYEFEYRSDEEAFKLQKYPLEFDSLYVRYEETYPDGLPDLSGALKQSRVFNPSGGEYVNLQVWGNGRQDTNFSPTDTAVYYDFPVAAGETVVTEYFFAWNDPAQSNGRYWVKRNGETLVAYDDLYLAESPVAAGVWVGGNASFFGAEFEPFRRQLRSVEILANPTGLPAGSPVGQNLSVLGDFLP